MQLTLQTGGFSSHTAIHAFRIGWLTARNAFQCFSVTNILADSIQVVITVKTGSNNYYRRPTINDPEKWTNHCPYQGSKSRKISYRVIVHEYVRGRNILRPVFTYGQLGSIRW